MIKIHHGLLPISKKKISNKISLFDKYIKNGKTLVDRRKVELARNDTINAINESKNIYYKRLHSKLINPNTSPKVYWSILKTLYSDKKNSCYPTSSS